MTTAKASDARLRLRSFMPEVRSTASRGSVVVVAIVLVRELAAEVGSHPGVDATRVLHTGQLWLLRARGSDPRELGITVLVCRRG
jgi:hypothetical protein